MCLGSRVRVRVRVRFGACGAIRHVRWNQGEGLGSPELYQGCKNEKVHMEKQVGARPNFFLPILVAEHVKVSAQASNNVSYRTECAIHKDI